jgi:SAM-dependent methyltransferase
MGVMQNLRHRIGAMQMKAMLNRVARDNASFDAEYGVETAQEVLLPDYDLAEDARAGLQPYSSVHEQVLRAIVGVLGRRVSEYEFLDIGSGKGKALLVASQFPFRSIRGVEISPRLHAIAERNIKIFTAATPTACQDVASLCEDARTLEDVGKKTFVFMFNPFGEELMADVVKGLERRIGQGASLVVAYLAPRARGPLDASVALRRLAESSRLLIYATPDVELDPSACASLERKFNTWTV